MGPALHCSLVCCVNSLSNCSVRWGYNLHLTDADTEAQRGVVTCIGHPLQGGYACFCSRVEGAKAPPPSQGGLDWFTTQPWAAAVFPSSCWAGLPVAPPCPQDSWFPARSQVGKVSAAKPMALPLPSVSQVRSRRKTAPLALASVINVVRAWWSARSIKPQL